jgi:hypothetical protein
MNRQERRRQAKLNKQNAQKAAVSHIRHKQNGGELHSFYWGWKADKHPEGFEFSTKTLTYFGMDVDTANKIGASVKEASDNQLLELINDNTMEYAGLSRSMFIIEEERRLKQSVDTFNAVIQSGPIGLNSLMPHIMVICCAISTLVAVGKIPQDTWNGDSFGYGFEGENSMERMLGLETA